MYYTLDLNFYTSEALDDATECVIMCAPQRQQSTNVESFLLFKFTELHHILGQKNPENSPQN